MSRKRKAPQRKIYPDPRFHSEVVSKFINSIMYDGKRSTAEKILYDALDKIKSKNNEDPIKIFNSAISIKPSLLRDNLSIDFSSFIARPELKYAKNTPKLTIFLMLTIFNPDLFSRFVKVFVLKLLTLTSL